MLFLRGFYWLAVLIVIKITFDWGRLKGFASRNTDGSLALGNIVRSLVMSFFVWLLLLLASAPLTMAAFKLARY